MTESMSTRIVACAGHMLKQQRTKGACAGGWGRHNRDNASLSATADALRVVGSGPSSIPGESARRAREFTILKVRDQLDNPATQASTQQIAAALRIHHELRGTRNPATSSEYGQVLERAQHALISPDSTLTGKGGKGWAPRAGESATLNATYHALWAVDLQIHDSKIEEAAVSHLNRAAREFVCECSTHHPGGAGRSWSQDGGPSLAASSLAVMSLISDHSRRHLDVIEEGVTWIASTLEQRLASGDSMRHWEPIDDADHDGFYPTTAMAALAWVRAQRAPIATPPPFLVESVTALDRMWSKHTMGWDAWGWTWTTRRSFVGTSRTVIALSNELLKKGLEWGDLVRSRSGGSLRRSADRPAIDDERVRARLEGRVLVVDCPSGAQSHAVTLNEWQAAAVRIVVEADGPVAVDDLAQRVADVTGSKAAQPTSVVGNLFGLRGHVDAHPELAALADLKGYPIDYTDRDPGANGGGGARHQVVALWSIAVAG